jgi:Tol biopolymer transport system component
MQYYTRIALASVALAIVIGAVIGVGLRGAPLTLIAQTPNGDAVAVGAPIRVTFARPVDRLSAEGNFRLEPYVPGRFFWQDTTLTYEPIQPLAPETRYRVTLLAGLRDAQGRANAQELSWEFQTRGPRLVGVRQQADGRSVLWLLRPDGSDATTLLVSDAPIRDLIVAPSGAQALIVVEHADDRTALELVNLDDGSTRPLVDDPQAAVTAPAWSAVGDFIVFERRTLTDPTPRLWLGQPDGTLLGPLYSGEVAEAALWPVWSPDGNRVAFGAGERRTLTVYDFFTDLNRDLGVASVGPATWLPDGSAIIVLTNDPTAQLMQVPYPEGAAQLVQVPAGEIRSFALSPDGAQIALVQPDAQGVPRVWVGAVATGAGAQLNAIEPLSTLHWSPDGTQLAFVSADGALVIYAGATGTTAQIFSDVTQVVWAP